MACHLRPSERDLLVRLWRQEVYRRNGFIEFPHQADVRLASEGLSLTDIVVPAPPESYQPLSWPPNPRNDYSLKATPIELIVACEPEESGAFAVGETGNFARKQWQLAVPRVVGTYTGPAHKLANLASFKAGKSKAAGMWVCGFSCLPGSVNEMVGLEYKTSEHEFNYLVEALLGGENAPIKKYKHFYNDVRQGHMLLQLQNNCTYEVRSWKNQDTLRGGQNTTYLYNEAYQLPGLTVYTGQQQNLRTEKGFAYFSTTADRPWVKVLHDMAHGKNWDWHCMCGASGYVNPLTFNMAQFMESAPDWETIMEYTPALLPQCMKSGLQPGRLMSRDKFVIAWLGGMGEFVGQVYKFQVGQRIVSPSTHPRIWKKDVLDHWLEQQAHILALKAQADAKVDTQVEVLFHEAQQLEQTATRQEDGHAPRRRPRPGTQK